MSDFKLHRPTTYKRRPTKTVWIGGLAVGGNYPIRVQSMATADTKDTAGVIREMEEMVEAGCEIVRLTVPTQADCDNLPNIRAEMKKRGIKVPLVADIHFTPSVAMKCVEFVDKVRINPGNFVDKKLFQVKEYTDAEYEAEIGRIREKFLPLVLKCKEHGVAMRIGTNHGSLSDRIMNRYGDTPEGMVESALEFLRICEEQEYRNIVLSMKASNVQVMTAAYRLLAVRLDELGWNYPLHLGVTEAGEGEDGRIKSAAGIGALLEDGLGDTIRVSLTEDPVFEVPVAYDLVRKYNAMQTIEVRRRGEPPVRPQLEGDHKDRPNGFNYSRRPNRNLQLGELYFGEKHPVRVWASVNEETFPEFEKEYSALIQKKEIIDTPLEGIEIVSSGKGDISPLLKQVKELVHKNIVEIPPALGLKTLNPIEAKAHLSEVSKVTAVLSANNPVPLVAWKTVAEDMKQKGGVIEWSVEAHGVATEDLENLERLLGKNDHAIFSLHSNGEIIYDTRRLVQSIDHLSLEAPLHLRYQVPDAKTALLAASVNVGALLLDGIGDSLQIEGPLSLKEKIKLSYNILQACRLRTSKTEYISCPSCGRTLFNLQTTTDKIREKTGHLKGVKIAVMGCIVNGPGEMADADFGYVGTGPKKISLYVGKECVQRNIPEEQAVDKLIDLIKAHDRWVDAPL